MSQINSLSREQIAYYRLSRHLKLSRKTLTLLKKHMGSFAAILDTAPSVLETSRSNSEVVQAIRLAQKMDDNETLCRLLGQGVRLVLNSADNFPERLKHLPDTPLALYYWGNEALLKHHPKIAMVGTRRASPYAEVITRDLVRQMLPYEPLILSGMAAGIDAAAHSAALEWALPSIGVLGAPIDQDYPACNKKIYQQMRERGLLISEIHPELYASRISFPERNRIVAGLADALIVIEAPSGSGALITANFACDYGVDVYVVPGPLDTYRNDGAYRLVNQGAQVLYDVAQIFSALKITPRQTQLSSQKNCDNRCAALLVHLSATPIHVDKLLQASLLPAPQALSLLSEALMLGLARELPGSYYVKG